MKPQTQSIRLTVDVEFDVFELHPLPPLTRRQKDEIVNNVLNGLIDQTDHVGIVPEDLEGFTRKITVRVGKSKNTTSYDFIQQNKPK